MKFSQRNRGAVALKKTGRTQHQIAKKIGASPAAVAYWQTGERAPGDKFRKLLHEAYAIPVAAWDEPIKMPARAPAPALQTSAPETVDVRPRAIRLQAQVDELLERALADESITSAEHAKVLASAASTLRVLFTMTGEGLEMSEARLLRLPVMARIRDTLVRVISEWPHRATECDTVTAKAIASRLLQTLQDEFARLAAERV